MRPFCTTNDSNPWIKSILPWIVPKSGQCTNSMQMGGLSPSKKFLLGKPVDTPHVAVKALVQSELRSLKSWDFVGHLLNNVA